MAEYCEHQAKAFVRSHKTGVSLKMTRPGSTWSRKLLLGVDVSNLNRKKEMFSFDTTSLYLFIYPKFTPEFVFASHCHGVKNLKPHHCLGHRPNQPSPKV